MMEDTGKKETVSLDADSERANGAELSDVEREESAPDERKANTLAAVPVKNMDAGAPLLSANEAGGLRSRWESIQIGFVDEPRTSVQQADQLVGDAIKKLTDGFADQRRKLEQQWGRGEAVSTEDLRLSLHRYRAFFERLVCI